ncbi:MAG: carbohydrate ABC transporter permease [Ruminococcus sp.]
MTYTEYMSLNIFQRFWYKLKEFFKAIPGAIVKFFCFIGRSIKNGAFAVGRGVKNFVMGFIKGDIITKISYFIMGFGNVFRGQIVKGIAFFALQVGYILFMVFFGGYYLSLFWSLEAVKTETVIEFMGQQITQTTVEAYSNQILLYGLLAIMATIAIFALYVVSTKSAIKNETIKKAGKQPPTFKEELKELLDSKFHSTMLSLPVILICVFVLLPLIFMIAMAFTNYSDKNYDSFNWVGLANFEEIFSVSESGGASMGYTFGKIAGWTIIWAIAATFSNYILGMIVALMINKKGIKLKKLWRTLFVMTIAVPQFVTLLVISQMLGASQDSPLNLIISMFTGTTSKLDLWSTANDGLLARITVIVVNCWVGIPYTILMTSGILMNIPEDLYESARIDGAGPVKSFTKITLPYMLFVTTPYLITTFIGNINNFNVIYLLSEGGPKVSEYKYSAGKTDLLITLLFKLSVNQNKYGLGAAIGILVFIVCATLSLITFNMTKSAKNEEEFS